jgi:hypothetical protein
MIVQLIDTINEAFVAELARLGWPPLADLPNGDRGRILVGRAHQFGQHVAPRVIFRPTKSSFGSKDQTLGANPTGAAPGRQTSEGRQAIANQAFLSEPFSFDVRCWGICPVNEEVEPRAGELDYTFTRGLYATLISVMQKIYPNSFIVGPGTWMDLRHVPREGQEFVFSLTIGIPVLRLGFSPPPVNGWQPGDPAQNSPLAPPPPPGGVQEQGADMAPAGVVSVHDASMVSPTGQSEPGCDDEE